MRFSKLHAACFCGEAGRYSAPPRSARTVGGVGTCMDFHGLSSETPPGIIKANSVREKIAQSKSSWIKFAGKINDLLLKFAARTGP